MEYIRTLTREFDVGDRVELRVENRAGLIAVRGEETQTVRVEVVARLWGESEEEADDQAELIARGIQHDAGHERVAIRAPALLRPASLLALFGRGPRIDYQLTVPRATATWLISRSGRIEAANLSEPLTIEARSGRVAVSDIAADISVKARSGAVQAEAIAGSLSVESSSGRVQARDCRGDVSVQVRSGSVQAEGVHGDLRVETRSGAIAAADVGGGVFARARSGTVRYEGAVRGDVDIEVMSGAIRLAVDRDSAFFLDAESLQGSVRSDLPLRQPTGGRASGPPAPTVRLRTHSGAIHLTPR